MVRYIWGPFSWREIFPYVFSPPAINMLTENHCHGKLIEKEKRPLESSAQRLLQCALCRVRSALKCHLSLLVVGDAIAIAEFQTAIVVMIILRLEIFVNQLKHSP